MRKRKKNMTPASSDSDLSIKLLNQLRKIKNKDILKLEVETDSEMREALTIFAEKYASGTPLYIIEESREYTPDEAAEILQVSLNYLNKLLDNDKIPYRTIDTHKRIKAKDLFSYKVKANKKSNEAFKKHSDIGRKFADD